jgi:hypothetical protein
MKKEIAREWRRLRRRIRATQVPSRTVAVFVQSVASLVEGGGSRWRGIVFAKTVLLGRSKGRETRQKLQGSKKRHPTTSDARTHVPKDDM